jgi:uncharacterized protein
VDREVTADFQEMFAYPGAEITDVRGRSAEPEAGAGGGAEEEEELLMRGDLFDLEPVVRDAVVLSLPLQPVCREDCPGLCPECGALLARDPEHRHDDAVDIRWAALQGLAETLGPESGEPAGDTGTQDTLDTHDSPEKPPRPGGDDPQEK